MIWRCKMLWGTLRRSWNPHSQKGNSHRIHIRFTKDAERRRCISIQRCLPAGKDKMKNCCKTWFEYGEIWNMQSRLIGEDWGSPSHVDRFHKSGLWNTLTKKRQKSLKVETSINLDPNTWWGSHFNLPACFIYITRFTKPYTIINMLAFQVS